MKLGIVGLPRSGKTTVFQSLAGRELPAGSPSRADLATAVVHVPDPRVDDLSERYRPKKTVLATVTFVDIGGIDPSGIHGPVRNELARTDALLHVVRDFESDAEPHPAGSIDPARDRAALESELLLLDMLTLDHRLERLAAERSRAREDARRAGDAEAALLSRLRGELEAETPLRSVNGMTTAEVRSLRGFGLLSLRPMLVVRNVGDEAPWSDEVTWHGGAAAEIALHGRLEAEIALLPTAERGAFLQEYGIDSPGADRVIRTAYLLAGRVSFFTVGPDEVRAWTVHRGATAVEAAGAIHTDLARGFIRAEVATYDDLVALGDMKAVKAAGRQRLEGRDYVVQDGDILTIRSGV